MEIKGVAGVIPVIPDRKTSIDTFSSQQVPLLDVGEDWRTEHGRFISGQNELALDCLRKRKCQPVVVSDAIPRQ